MKNFFLISILLVMIAMSGCASLLVANPSGRQTGGSSVSSSDARITNAVNAALVRERSISSLDVYVSTYNGIVTLKGYVASQAIKNRAGQVAASSSGVKSVRNQLRIK
jgi:osmotically-inducible protein OsmY